MCMCRSELIELDRDASRVDPGEDQYKQGYQAGFLAAIQEAREIHEVDHDSEEGF